MNLYEIIHILNSSLINVCIIGTIITVLLALITLISKNKVVKKTTILVTVLLIILWISEIGMSVYLLLGKSV